MEEINPQSGSEKPLDQEIQSQRPLPNATATLILGIASIPLCCCMNGTVSIIAAVVALVISGKDRKRYFDNPDVFSRSSYKNLNAGRICAIIGLILGGLALISIIIAISMGLVSGFFTTDPQEFEEMIKRFEELE